MSSTDDVVEWTRSCRNAVSVMVVVVARGKKQTKVRNQTKTRPDSQRQLSH